MKIKTLTKTFDEVMALPRMKHRLPKRPNLFFRTLVRAVSQKPLKEVGFTYTKADLGEAEKEPCLILMNHSCFLDLSIVSKMFYPRPYGIVCTSDGFVGKGWLMRELGCIPTQKFVSDVHLIRDMEYMLKKKKTSVLMYPEASYSFDGRATPLPRHLGDFLKKLDVPVVMVRTQGAFLRDPLYNGLRLRNVKVSAEAFLLLSREQIREKTNEEMKKILDDAFNFDWFADQAERRVSVSEPFRAEGLERVLYKCPHCLTEGKTRGQGEKLICHACRKEYRLTEFGQMEALSGETEIPHIPTWYQWERESVREELEKGEYSLDTDVTLGMMIDTKAIYMVGDAHLHHDNDGFLLTGEDGRILYRQSPLSSYGLYADYFWYEIGDMICIGNHDCLFYCFPKKEGVVAKTRLAAEELFKLRLEKVRSRSAKINNTTEG